MDIQKLIKDEDPFQSSYLKVKLMRIKFIIWSKKLEKKHRKETLKNKTSLFPTNKYYTMGELWLCG